MSVNNSGASLTGATSAAPGTAITFTTVCQRHGMAVVVSGYQGSGNARINLEISMDDANWFPCPAGGVLVVSGNGTYYVRSQDAFPALYARANLVEIDPAVSAINVSATLASE
jgi:hypothetical protein